MKKLAAIRLLFVATLCAAGAYADELRLSRPADWQTWAIPRAHSKLPTTAALV